ncbi:M28 family peptidase [Kaarinaea lacus]
MRKIVIVSLTIASIAFSCFVFVIIQPLAFSSIEPSKVNVNPEALKKHVVTLSEENPPRGGSDDGLNVSADYIKKQFSIYGEVQETLYTLDGNSYRNISIIFGDKANERIVVGAHYDSFLGLPGADDNASGVAGLIELAGLLSKTDLQRTVELVAYTLEEPPYFRTEKMGSAIHARSLKENNVKVIVMMSLEMIGYFSDESSSQEYPLSIMKLFYPTTGNYIAVVSNFSNLGVVRTTKSAMKNVMKLPLRSLNAPGSVVGVDFSDHLNFWMHDYPALMITDTAFYRNKAYHTENDTWESLDYKRMSEVVKGVHSAVLKFSNS